MTTTPTNTSLVGRVTTPMSTTTPDRPFWMDAPPSPPRWQEHALCGKYHIPLSFFRGGRGKNPRDARDFCSACPVQLECLRSRLAVPVKEDSFIVVGGLTHSQRAKVRSACRDEAKRRGEWSNLPLDFLRRVADGVLSGDPASTQQDLDSGSVQEPSATSV